MEDMLQSQIQDSCKLALPNGVKELMSDISREVLRAQPRNLLKFITDYLSAMLVTRENLSIAARVCSAICDCSSRPELDEEFKNIGLNDEEAADAADIIEEFFGKGEVNEGNLLIKLAKKTSINENQLPELLAAIRRAFLTHQRNHTRVFETSLNRNADETENAVRHTLVMYRKTNPSDETYDCMARKIQAAYRAYRVKRHRESIRSNETEQLESADKTENSEKSKVTFGTVDKTEESFGSIYQPSDTGESEDSAKTEAAQSQELPGLDKISSTSLAGSYLSLPKYKPYSAHDIGKLLDLEELPEKERSNFDYTRENSLHVNDIRDKDMSNEKKIENEDSNTLFYESEAEEEDAEENSKTESIISEVIEEEDIAEEDSMERNKNRAEVMVKEDILEEDNIERDVIKEDMEEDIINEVIEKDNEDIAEDIVEKPFLGNDIVEDDFVEECLVEDDFMEEYKNKVEHFEEVNVTGSY